jgi:site-specific DNA-cytosine methylase
MTYGSLFTGIGGIDLGLDRAGFSCRWQGTPLTIAATTWPTARAEDSESCGNHPGATDSLTGATRLWRTPDVPGTDSFRSRGGDRKDEMGLDQEARHWQTPNARDWKSETGSENNSYDKTPNLSRQVYRLSHPAPQIHDGPQSSENGQTSHRRLNPRFVSWLMGFPPTWTELD